MASVLRPHNRAIMRRSVRYPLGGLLFLLLWGNPPAGADEPTLYKASRGPYAVGVVPEASLADDTRGVQIPLRITYPLAEGLFPVIVFSHGAWGAHYHYAGLTAHWASHGYVVIQPAHAGSRD
jgi:predicted dienelactone hydrolase